MEFFLPCILLIIHQKTCLMRRLIIISALCLTAILIGAFYSLVDGIICGSYLGVTLSLSCIAALFIGIRYFKKMMKQAAEEETY